ncbi:MAG: hypothetical protein ACC634_06005, partial [Hyphomicrobiales bacterium]
MNTDVFEKLSGLIKTKSGIVLTPAKTYLLKSRLTPVARSFGFESIEEMVAALRTHVERTRIEGQIIEAMTTNESLFFRDKTPFEAFREVMVPHFLEARAPTKRLRVWCAATGVGSQRPTGPMPRARASRSRCRSWRRLCRRRPHEPVAVTTAVASPATTPIATPGRRRRSDVPALDLCAS